MTDEYHIDLERISLVRFRHILETKDLLPGRMVLRDRLSERFEILASMGISSLRDLTETLSTKKRIEVFSRESGLPRDYLVILRREANSYVAKPFNLKDIPGVEAEYVERLTSCGVKHTKHLFERARSKSERAELSRLAGVPEGDLLELVKLSDLARIGGVGPVFARILYEAGADTLEEFLKRAPDKLIESLHEINDEKKYTKSMPTLKDIDYCIETARELPKVVEYE